MTGAGENADCVAFFHVPGSNLCIKNDQLVICPDGLQFIFTGAEKIELNEVQVAQNFNVLQAAVRIVVPFQGNKLVTRIVSV